jgi:hypothetical protein
MTIINAFPGHAGRHDTNTAVDVSAIDRYLAAWNETDPAARAALLEQAVAADLWYRDPLIEADGREGFAATLGFVQEHYPGHVIVRTSDVDAHHDLVRFNWAFGVPGEDPVLSGVDVAKFDADGRLHRIIGFVPATLT